ncbi:MAG: hypothetical protein HN742_14035 [Lentisphaerae bacterium]|jgi:hypothetical protein|nr:hypothetical protein [Lentisphaerota bacterium]MBT7056910.1 hypothetical protein [Lentisphaerota bacterium]MBT7842994.1 hypothetical protein [Lentisphaerota bacterium]
MTHEPTATRRARCSTNILMAVACLTCSAQERATGHLPSLDDACEGLKTYLAETADVYLPYRETQTVRRKSDKRQVSKSEAQYLFARKGDKRYFRWATDADLELEEKLYDGTLLVTRKVHKRWPKHPMALISRNPERNDFLNHYGSTAGFGRYFFQTPLADVLARRSKLTLLPRVATVRGSTCCVLDYEVCSTPKHEMHWRIHLAVDRGYAPVRYEVHGTGYGTDNAPLAVYEATRFAEGNAGTLYPVAIECTCVYPYAGKDEISQQTVTVDQGLFRCGEAVPVETFHMIFTPGTQITDENDGKRWGVSEDTPLSELGQGREP